MTFLLHPARAPHALIPHAARIAWTSDRAQEVWARRLAQIHYAWVRLEELSVLAGLRQCALLTVRSSDVAPKRRLRWLELPTIRGAEYLVCGVGDAGTINPSRYVLGRSSDTERFKDAWLANDVSAIASMLGYPPCCQESLVASGGDGGGHLIDPTWATAARTPKVTWQEMTAEIGGPSCTNILWRGLGVRVVPNLPCRFDCHQTISTAAVYLDLADRSSLGEWLAWANQILSWPAEWSALHGIAEVKTPILRMTQSTNATAGKYVLRWKGDAYPEEGARGVQFPYAPPRRPHATASRGFQRGLEHASAVANPTRDTWYHTDNGFSSTAHMRERHRTVVALAREELGDAHGPVLDLGCGNGALLQSLCLGQPGLEPFGVDVNERALEHARELMPRSGANFVRLNIFAREVWSARRYLLALISIKRLLEVQSTLREKLLADIRSHCERLLIYQYDNDNPATLGELAGRAGLKLARVQGPVAAVAVLTAPRRMSPSLDGALDWTRMARPQADGYDTEIVLRLRQQTRPPGDAKRSGPRPAGKTHTLFGGRVAVVNRSWGGLAGKNYVPAPCDHPNLGKAAGYLQAWPEISRQFPQIVDTIQPWIDTSRTPREWLRRPGSSSHSLEEESGTIMVTVDNAIGLANALVHEMAHHKLRALGVSLLTASRLITNDPRESYFSPIKDRPRPMTAVIHAQYSFIHVLSLECALQLGEQLTPDEKRSAIPRLAWHLEKMQQGYHQIDRHVRTDSDGADFMCGFQAWSREVLACAESILKTARRQR